jgi:hypothetical protein
MARALTPRLALLAAVLGASLAARPAAALGPDQPFTPPAAARQNTGAGAPTEAPAEAATASAPPASGLTGVRLGSSPRALIDGEWVALGAPAREGRLVAVRAHEVVLRLAGGGHERLALFPPLPPLAGSPAEPGSSILKRDLP